jgi:ABC-type glycerol-3-phosphate transport system substrate-binding protein
MMKNARKRFLKLSAALLIFSIAIGLCACGGNSHVSSSNDTSIISQESSKDSTTISSPTETSPYEGKIELTIAGFYISGTVEKMVQVYNETNDKYYITLVDYVSYQNESGKYYRDGLEDVLYQQIMQDIVNGEGPDMLWFENGWDSTLPCQQFEAAGFLTDLMPYFEADTTFSLDELLPNVVDACTIDGQLCKLPVGSYIMTYISQPLLDEEGLSSLDEFSEVMSAMPNGSVAIAGMTQSELLQKLLIFDGEQFVNNEAQTASFDSDAFIDMLEFSAKYGLDDSATADGTLVYDFVERLSNGTVALSPIIVRSPWSLDDFDVGKTVTGLPGASQSDGYIFPLEMIAATTCSKHPDGAYEFIKLMMSEEAQSIVLGYEQIFPTRRSVYEYMVGITDYPENFDEVSLAYLLDDGADGDTESPVPTAEQIAALNEQFIELCDHTTLMYYPDAYIINIIMAEAPYYFSGQESAEDVAVIIQNRASVIMSMRN